MHKGHGTAFIKEFRISGICAIVLLLILLGPPVVPAADIVAIQGVNIRPYNNAIKGLESSCNCTVKKLVISEMQGKNITKEVRDANPRVIVSAGVDALKSVHHIKDVPLVYLMVLNTHLLLDGRDNIKGISMVIDPEKQLKLISKTIPNIRRLGILYSQAIPDSFIDELHAITGNTAITLHSQKVLSPKDVPVALNNLKSSIDAFWMLPDTGVVTRETEELFFLFSLTNKVPVITFAAKYLEMGAILSLDIDPYDMGIQAGNMVWEILSGKNIKDIKEIYAQTANISVNMKTAHKLGAYINQNISGNSITVASSKDKHAAEGMILNMLLLK